MVHQQYGHHVKELLLVFPTDGKWPLLVGTQSSWPSSHDHSYLGIFTESTQMDMVFMNDQGCIYLHLLSLECNLVLMEVDLILYYFYRFWHCPILDFPFHDIQQF